MEYKSFTIPQITLLEGKNNWENWKIKIRMGLKIIPRAIDIIDGVFKRPSLADGADDQGKKLYEKELATFLSIDNQALLVISNNMTEEMFEKVRRHETARDMWLGLGQLFDTFSEDRIFDLYNKFFESKWLPNDDTISFITRISNAWNQLKGEIDKQTYDNKNILLICKILKTLPDKFKPFTSGWRLINEDNRSLDKLTQKLCTYESNLNDSCSEEVLVARGNKSQNKSFHNKNTNLNKYSLICYYCDKKGHKIQNCRYWLADGKPPKPAKAKFVKNNSGKGETLLTVNSEVFNLETNNDCWFVDNGATNHICNKREWFQNFESFKDDHEIITADGSHVRALGKGSISIEAAVDGHWKRFELTNVWLVPGISKNLFSLLAAQDHRPRSKFESTAVSCKLYEGKRILVSGSRQVCGGLYKLAIRFVPSAQSCNLETNLSTPDKNHNLLQLYHERMGHQNKRHVKEVVKKELNLELTLDGELCEGCIKGKAHRLKFGRRKRAEKTGEVISTDVCGPFIPSKSGFKYFLVFKDDYSKFRKVYFIKTKDEVFEKLKEFLAEANTLGHKIMCIQCDNGREFKNERVEGFLKSKGIEIRYTMPYTPQQNGCAERENRTIVETARALMHSGEESLPKELWAEMINTAAYILNRTGPSSEKGKPPFEHWMGRKPGIKNLRVIGSKCWVHIPKENRRKFDKKARKGVLVGYDGENGYRVFSNNELIRSRDVIFQESLKTPVCENYAFNQKEGKDDKIYGEEDPIEERRDKGITIEIGEETTDGEETTVGEEDKALETEEQGVVWKRGINLRN